jgi:hypothetical protein
MAAKIYRCVVTFALLFAIVTMARGFAPDAPKCATPTVVDDPTYKPGQVWSYKTRAGDEDSTVTILRVESTPKLGTIVHVQIQRWRLENCHGNTGDSTMDHAPFSKAAIDKSVVKLLRTDKDIPNFEEGYRDWLSHCGGVYTMSVADALTLTNKRMKEAGCK